VHIANTRNSAHQGFTLIELLVVIAVIAILAGMMMPAFSAARESSRRSACLSNLRQIAIAIHTYANDNEGRIPFGPKAPPFTNPADFYPSTGAPTSLISLAGGGPVGLGLLLHDYLERQPRVLFCPGNDQMVDANSELAKVGVHQSQGSYYYRHGGNTRLFDNPDGKTEPDHLQLDNLGLNRNGRPIRALAIDTLFLCPAELASLNIKPRTHHRLKFADILFSDGHAVSRPNQDARYVVDLRNYAEVRNAFDKILQVLEQADAEP
jgi:prepilin-type N-terminal cleavage/methylation domain-containing protein